MIEYFLFVWSINDPLLWHMIHNMYEVLLYQYICDGNTWLWLQHIIKTLEVDINMTNIEGNFWRVVLSISIINQLINFTWTWKLIFYNSTCLQSFINDVNTLMMLTLILCVWVNTPHVLCFRCFTGEIFIWNQYQNDTECGDVWHSEHWFS